MENLERPIAGQKIGRTPAQIGKLCTVYSSECFIGERGVLCERNG